MFILRRISGEGIQMNHVVGEGYTLISREVNYAEFCKAFKQCFERDHVADNDPSSDNNTKNVYAFVGNGSFNQPLYQNQKNYIMMENGRTFDNLSFR